LYLEKKVIEKIPDFLEEKTFKKQCIGVFFYCFEAKPKICLDEWTIKKPFQLFPSDGRCLDAVCNENDM